MYETRLQPAKGSTDHINLLSMQSIKDSTPKMPSMHLACAFLQDSQTPWVSSANMTAVRAKDANVAVLEHRMTIVAAQETSTAKSSSKKASG